MNTFDELFEKLNDAQKKAVESTEGPVMVIAGPGTGKTQVVAMRVANILRKTHMRPSNILCLTFSSSGATAMRERLRSLIGSDAYGVTISTIHGFCNDIIQQYPNVFETWASLEQISDVERYRVINAIIDEFLPDLAIVNRKHPYGRTKDILDRISLIKREGKTLEDLKRVAGEFEEELLSKSKKGTKAYEKNEATARKFHEFVKFFARYQEILKETQRYDYDDMILHVIQALQDEDWLLAGLQERYQYVLVDEFQDTNGAQYRFIDLLTTYATVEHDPNLFVVGDDDQAIYRFQGANLQNILSFYKRFPKASIVVLTTSYRCTQTILDAAGNLIGHNTERLVGTIPGLTKDLTSGNGVKGDPPTLYRSASDVAEPWMVADLVEEEIAKGTDPQEIAILAQKNNELPLYYDVLRARDIPVQMDGKIDLLKQPIVLQALSILRAIRNPDSSSALAAALSASCFGCRAADVGRLYLAHRGQSKTLREIMFLLDDPSSDVAALPLVDRECIARVRDILESLHQNIPNRTLIDTLEHVLKDCNLLPSPRDGKPFDTVVFAALQAFFDRVRYRSYEQTTFSFETFVDDLEFYTNADYGELKMSFAIPHLSMSGVRLMTAHASKGLEFEVVILTNFKDRHWDRRRTPPSLTIPEDLLFGWEKEQKEFEQHQDERRVAYVAMTRAKRRLLMTCPLELTSGDKLKDVSPSGFFVEAGKLPEETKELLQSDGASTLLLAPKTDLDEEFKAFLRERLEDFKLSVTALNHFLENPDIFLESDLLQSPQVKNTSLVYGNAVHAAMRKWGLSVQQGIPMGLEQFLAEFSNYLVDREILTEKERKILITHGNENLPRYYEQRLKSPLPVVHKVEYAISTYLDDPSHRAEASIPLKGKLDRVDIEHPDSARATIIDFKTGHPLTESQIKDGDYYRQLVFYSILLEKGNPLLEPVSYVLDFIGEGTDHPIERKFLITESDRQELSSIIRAVWTKIQALDFTKIV